MEILDDHQQRPLAQAMLEHAARGHEYLPLELFRFQIRETLVARPEAKDVAQIGRHFMRFGAFGTDRLKAGYELFFRRLKRIVLGDRIAVAQQTREHAEGSFAERRRGGAANRHPIEPAVASQPSNELLEKPGFADPGIAEQAHHLSPSLDRAVEQVAHLVDFVLAPDQRRGKPVRRQAAAGTGLLVEPPRQ